MPRFARFFQRIERFFLSANNAPRQLQCSLLKRLRSFQGQYSSSKWSKAVQVTLLASPILYAIGPQKKKNDGTSWLDDMVPPRYRGHFSSVVGLVFVNLAVFALWSMTRLPFAPASLASFMRRFFLASPVNTLIDKRFYLWITSAFSHMSLLHFAANMYVFYMFSLNLKYLMRNSEIPKFYLSAALFSGMFGDLFFLTASKLLRNKSTVIRNLVRPSLGASGAVIAFCALSTVYMPSVRYSVIFFPSWKMTGEQLLLGMALFEGAGCILCLFKSLPMNHPVHLGGIIFGYLYARYRLATDKRLKGNCTQLKNAYDHATRRNPGRFSQF
eukprot:TRINITY_DN3987_c0_g1_i1.p1 TRINITY_DN3987_c0_g1~~TRINITY_DN3987_c0_g1_i1.p1  ORF type:complete len:328 (+),score=45.34 TRINITY_DN3987_c0_g1_i1:136-1119(+)